ncbi:unnamed protein product, partial [Discosporangium mesarthrocarpum]
FFQKYEPTFRRFLNETVGVQLNISFDIVPLGFDEIPHAVGNRTIDFLFTNPSMYNCMDSEFLLSPMVSLRNLQLGEELNKFGGVVITASGRTGITSLYDLKDQVVEGVSISGLGAFQMQWGLMQEMGVNLMVETSAVRFAYNQKQIVRDVISGEVDAGFVRTGLMEGMAVSGLINMSDWSLGALSHVPAEVTKEVAVALMGLNSTHYASQAGGYSTWDSALSYTGLRSLQVSLGILDDDTGTCIDATNYYDGVKCPTGYYKVSHEEATSRCTEYGGRLWLQV